MKINLGDLFVLLNSEVYYVADVQYDEERNTKKYILILLNPTKGIRMRKRIMYPDNIEHMFNPDTISHRNWKYYPVKK